MPRFIEEFYYGNIDPQARSTKENKTVQKQMEILMKNEDLLTNALTDKPKKWFLDYVNAWGVVNGESNLDSFIMASASAQTSPMKLYINRNTVSRFAKRVILFRKNA